MEEALKIQEVIKMKNIEKVYDMGSSTFTALENIDLTINKGEYVAVVGPSGAGK
jgi:putative ABC transport system ATP-binding protein